MNRKNITQTIVVVALSLTVFLTSAFGAEPQPPSKSQATQLLTLMGYKDIQVGAIIASGSSSTVIGIGRDQSGQVVSISEQLFYDADIGWFRYEFDNAINPLARPTKLRMWTLSGYKEVLPKQEEKTDKAQSP
jgi:hypothetical protein